MELLKRGIQTYLVVLAGITVLTIVWGANIFWLGNTTAEIGWPILIGLTFVVVALLVWVHQRGDSAKELDTEPFDWNSRK